MNSRTDAGVRASQQNPRRDKQASSQSSVVGCQRPGATKSRARIFGGEARGKIAVAGLLASLAVVVAGCAQQTESITDQPARQIQPQEADQTANAGNYKFTVNVINSTQGVPGEIDGTLFAGLDAPQAESQVDEARSDAGGNAAKKIRSGNTIAGTTFHVTMGGNSGGTQSAAATGSQAANPNSSTTQTPNQEPKVSTTVPIAVGMPGSAPQASGSGTVEGPASTSAQLDAQLSTLTQRAAKGDPAAIEALRAWLARQPTVTPVPQQP